LAESVTSHKKDDRHLIEKASTFLVNYEDKELKVTLAMTDEEKRKKLGNNKRIIHRKMDNV